MGYLRKLQRADGGFTLVEVLVTITLLLVGVLGTVTLIDGANATTGRTLAREGATSLARQIGEGSRAVPYAQLLSRGSLEGKLKIQAGLADTGVTDADWTVERRGITYTVVAEVCSVDDVLDGHGSHPGGFCVDTPAAGTADSDPDDYKRVTATLAWRRQGRTEQVKHVTVIPNPGSAAGPRIDTFEMTAPLVCSLNMASCPTIATPGSSEASFSVETASPVQTVAWSVDGEVQPSDAVTGSGTGWSFDWPLGSLPDGTYQVAAQAFAEASGPGLPAAGGPRRVLTVALNRRSPAAPSGFLAGRTPSSLDGHSVVELEWLAHSDRDVEGYRVYRVVGEAGGGDDMVVCPSSGNTPLQETGCQDNAPPDLGSVAYYVVAVDRHPDVPNDYRLGDRSQIRAVQKTNLPPYAPSSVALSTAGGDPLLTWTAVSPPDPDPGDSVEFYRIYRGGTTVADRYDRVTATTLAYTDGRSGGESHRYWVTAVDGQLGESRPVEAVTGP